MRPILLVLASTYPRWPDDPEPGFVHELSKRLSRQFEVTVIGPHAPGAKREETMDGVRVLRYRYAPERFETLVNNGGIVTNLRRSPWKWLLVPGFMFGQWLALRRWVRASKPDAIHAHWLIPQGLVASVANSGVPFVVTSHGADLFSLGSAPLQALKRLVIRRAAVTTVVSTAMRDELALVGVDTSNVRVHPMGVDLIKRFIPDADVLRSSDEILFVGRLVEKKGLRYLIDALPAVLSAHSSAYVTIAGFGPELSDLQIRIKRLGLTEKVSFIGAISQVELPQLYRRAAVFVAPFIQTATGDREGLGLVSVEAAGCECPIVVNELPAVRQAFPDADMVLWAPQRDTSVLASQILSVLKNPELAHTRAMLTRASVVKRFDWSVIAHEYAQLLYGVMRSAPTQMARR